MPNDLFSQCEMADLNHVLFRCEEEERDFTKGSRGTYSISNRKFEYAGLVSIANILE
jgi:glycogen debranching enzyme